MDAPPSLEFGSLAEAWIFVVFALVIGVGGLAVVPRAWRGELPAFRRLEAPSFWPFPDALWRGFIRVAPVNAVGFGLLFILLAGEVLLAEPGLLSTALVGSRAARMLVAIAIFLIVIPLDIAIVFLGRPRRLVPPHVRHLPGAIAEWRGAPWRTGPARP
jgi:hypothetical protein